METYFHNIEYLVKNSEEIDKLSKIIEEIPIDVPFHTTMVIEPNRLPKEHFPHEIIIYLDKKSERLNFENYQELKQKFDLEESGSEIRSCANIADKNLLLHEIKTTDKSCKILSADGPEGVMVVYGTPHSPKKAHLTFWEGAYSDFL